MKLPATPLDDKPSPDGLRLAAARAALRSALIAARNSDGGWAYRPGNRSRLEPTCWALLALAHAAGQPPDVEVLRRWHDEDGWLVDVSGAPPNVAFNAVAALTLLQAEPRSATAQRLLGRIVRAKGDAIAQNPFMRQDNSLQAWSWVGGTFSWVEPTAWCLLLLKQCRARGPLSGADERILVAERMLADRACRAGGWNYGNANAFGQDLRPYVPTTALALLALQDRRGMPVVEKALDAIQMNVATERSAISLATTIICLRVHGLATTRWEKELAALVSRRGVEGDPTYDRVGAAAALYALTDRAVVSLAVQST